MMTTQVVFSSHDLLINHPSSLKTQAKPIAPWAQVATLLQRYIAGLGILLLPVG